MASEYQSPPTFYYLIFTDPHTFRVHNDTEENMAQVRGFYKKIKVPDVFQEGFQASAFNISLSEDGHLIIEKKPKPLEDVRTEILRQAEFYGNSPEVDANTINGQPVVIDIATRLKIQERLLRKKAKGQTVDTIRMKGLKISLPIDAIQDLLEKIADRAIENYEVLQNHIEKILSLTDEKSLRAYDYKTGYLAALEWKLG